MTVVSDGAETLNSFMTVFLNEDTLQNGLAVISERGVRGYGDDSGESSRTRRGVS
jgi:hypothetical protein